jgi:Raf kinase inhibitor-like YbhB/YbcL family protein
MGSYRRKLFLLLVLFLIFPLVGLAQTKPFELKSPVFDNGGIIPKTFTCDGRNISPPLYWVNPPPDTKSFVLIMHDPDAPSGDFTHWVVYDIPSDLRGLPRNFPRLPEVKGIKQGYNSFGYIGYGGPCPPPWHGYHHYYFELYALDIKTLGLPPAVKREEVEKAMKGHILGKAVLVGLYKRERFFFFSLK